MINDSDVRQPNRTFDNSRHVQNYNPYDFHTISAIEDDLTFHLSSKCEFQIDDETKRIRIKHKYLDKADKFLFLINLFKPIPRFEISRSDIPRNLEEALSSFDKESVNSILTNVIRRILESVNPVYYHINGIHGKVLWRIID